MEQFVAKDTMLHWNIVQRGYWVHGVDNLRDCLREAQRYTLEGRLERIECPTLVTLAEGDPLPSRQRATSKC